MTASRLHRHTARVLVLAVVHTTLAVEHRPSGQAQRHLVTFDAPDAAHVDAPRDRWGSLRTAALARRDAVMASGELITARVHRRLEHSLPAVVVDLTSAQVAHLRSLGGVKVAPDARIRVHGDLTMLPLATTADTGVVSEPPARRRLYSGRPIPEGVWALQRLQDGPERVGHTYGGFMGADGCNSVVYVFDTGIDETHPEFSHMDGMEGVDFYTNGTLVTDPPPLGTVPIQEPVTVSPVTDPHWHGTACAGLIAGRYHGVAKHTKLVSVRVIGADGMGTYSDLLAALDWAVSHDAGPRRKVFSLSLGCEVGDPGCAHPDLRDIAEDAADFANSNGIVSVAATSQARAEQCDMLPASLNKVIAAGSIDRHDHTINDGHCVDLWAPGVDVQVPVPAALMHHGHPPYVNASGTSFAAALVSGVAAEFFSNKLNQDAHAMVGELRKDALKDQIYMPKDEGDGSVSMQLSDKPRVVQAVRTSW